MRKLDLTLPVPADASGKTGRLSVSGGPLSDETGDGAIDGPALDSPDGDDWAASEPESFGDVLEGLQSLVPNNSVTATLTVDTVEVEGSGAPQQVTVTEQVDHVVTGERSAPVTLAD